MTNTLLHMISGKKYNIIYADPPWQYNDKSLSHGGGAEQHYPCMSTGDICDLPVSDLAEKDAVLFLWATYPMLPDALDVVRAWKFTYKTVAYTWVKTNENGRLWFGMGHYTRSNAEICLLAIRGNGIPRISANIPNTQLHKKMEHSRKPGKFRNDIVRLYGDVPRVELFSREKINGWDVWGNEIPSSEQQFIEKIV